MPRKQLLALAACNLGIYMVGFMVITLLPVYAVELGMAEGEIGIFLALAHLGLAIGTLLSGWLSDQFQRRRLAIFLISAIGIPATFLIGQAGSVVLMALFTTVVLFVSGIGMGAVTILAGLYVSANERGRVFGILVSALFVGGALGSFASGAVVERWGFTALFSAAALVWIISLVAALFLDDAVTTHPQVGHAQPAAPLSRALWLLIIANILVSITNFSAILARPLKMNELAFDPNSISSTAAIGSLAGIPLPFLIGWFSDRMGRKQLLIASYMLMAVGALVLAAAVDLWQFSVTAILFTLADSAGGVANAFVTDLAAPETLSTALARYSATTWVGAVVGFSLSGIVIQGIGLPNTLLFEAALPLAAILLLSAIRRSPRLAPA